MQKAESTVSGDNMIVTIARFGSAPQNVEVPQGSTVNDVISEAGIAFEGREELFVEGVKAEGADVLESGDILSIVTPKQAG